MSEPHSSIKRKRQVIVMGNSSAGNRHLHLPNWLTLWESLLLAGDSDLGCCGTTAKACPALRLLPLTFFTALPVSTSNTARVTCKVSSVTTWPQRQYSRAWEPGWFYSQSYCWEGRWNLQVNNCLHIWCWQQGFCFYTHGTLSLRIKDCCSTKWGESILVSRLDNLIRRSLG